MAVALMIGFYVLAVAVAGLLLWLPYAEWRYANKVHVKLALFCVVSGVVILWSIVPRRDKFAPPGPRLDARGQPRLFQEIEAVARATNQPPPAEVYLVNEVNAWVAERGGWMGQGGRRVMGLGLPLLQLLKIGEFRGVLAHEFGHFHGGDTKLGPWVYKTRGAMGRTLQGLEDSILQKPFIWYGKLFLRVTHAISRAQEFAADALGARVAGRAAMSGGLQQVHGAGQAFDAYWRGEAVPVLRAGYQPSLTEGFTRFLGEQSVSRLVNESLDQVMQRAQADPYDTHPALPERLAALERLPAGPVAAAGAAAVTLLDGVPALERELLVTLAGADAAGKLQPVAWEEVGEKVFLPQWRAVARKHAAALQGVTPGTLPVTVGAVTEWARRVVLAGQEQVLAADQPGYAGQVVGCALAVVLQGRGVALRCLPGAPVSCGAVEPFRVLDDLVAGRLPAAEWRRQCAALGIADVDLGRV